MDDFSTDATLKILDGMPRNRQTLLFSATMPREVEQIAHKYMKNPQMAKVSEDKLAVEGIRQLYVRSSSGQRLGMLLAAFKAEKPFLSLVSKRRAPLLDLVCFCGHPEPVGR